MAEDKNLKVPEQTHRMLNSRADALGMKIKVLTDTLLRAGLTLTDQEIFEAVVNTRQLQVKQPKADTTQARPPDQSPAREPSGE